MFFIFYANEADLQPVATGDTHNHSLTSPATSLPTTISPTDPVQFGLRPVKPSVYFIIIDPEWVTWNPFARAEGEGPIPTIKGVP